MNGVAEDQKNSREQMRLQQKELASIDFSFDGNGPLPEHINNNQEIEQEKNKVVYNNTSSDHIPEEN